MQAKSIELKRVGILTPRERMWEAIRNLRRFSVLQLQDTAHPLVTMRSCESYVSSLHKAGYLKQATAATRAPRGVIVEGTYELVKDSLEPPRIDKQGVAVKQGLARLAMWRAMQILKSFDYTDITRAASLPGSMVSAETAKSYVNLLSRAGYFRTMKQATPNTPARYRLLNNTGPQAPAITRRKVVLDRNDGQFKWQESAQEVVDGLE